MKLEMYGLAHTAARIFTTHLPSYDILHERMVQTPHILGILCIPGSSKHDGGIYNEFSRWWIQYSAMFVKKS
jgi:hypothetical protein